MTVASCVVLTICALGIAPAVAAQPPGVVPLVVTLTTLL